MKWIIRITNHKNKRISVEYKPEINKIIFNGEYKYFGNWIVINSKDINGDDIKKIDYISIISDLSEELVDIINKYSEINEIFSNITEIEIVNQ